MGTEPKRDVTLNYPLITVFIYQQSPDLDIMFVRGILMASACMCVGMHLPGMPAFLCGAALLINS